MSYASYATRLHFAEISSNDNTAINSGESVMVHKIIVSNRSGGSVLLSFTDNDGTELFEFAYADGGTPEDTDIMTFFDNGFKIPSLDTGVRVLITYRPSG